VTAIAPTGTYSTGNGTEVQSAANAVTGSTYDQWTATPDGSGFAAWKVDFGAARSPTFCGIAAHNIADVGGSIMVQHSSDDLIWSTLHSVTPTDNAAVGIRFTPTSARYWRVLISGLSGDVSIGVIWLGAEIIIPQRIYQSYAPPLTPNVVDLNTSVSEGQHLLGSVSTVRGSLWDATIDHVEPTFFRGAEWMAFQRHWNGGGGAFWAWRPTKYGDLLYSWRRGSVIAPNNSGPAAFMSVTIAGRAYDK
jgi:hypothetical protein